MKKLIIAITSVLILTGCGSDSNEEIKENINFKLYSSNEIEIQIPIDWEIIKKENFTSNISKDTIVAFLSNEKDENFTSNINITKLSNTEITLENFSKASIANAKKKLLEFKNISSDINSINELEAISYVFSGKQKADQSILDFKQTFIKKNTDIYIITYAYLPYEEIANVDEINTVVNSFIIK